MLNEDSREKLLQLLDNNHTWPDYYHFKFIVKEHAKEEITQIFEKEHITIKESSRGNYLSITVRKMINHSHEVLAVYEEVGKIEGVITL